MFPSAVARTIKKVCNDKIVQEFVNANRISGNVLYLCSKISVYGTEYRKNNYIVLPGSKNSAMKFGKIVSLLCCIDYAYFKYEETKVNYNADTDLHFVTGTQKYNIVPQYHLPDYRLEVLSKL